ncbi:sensor histidine kinase [Cryptosporangium aurantiacum]|uniref:histidine kinase n=1 Tax=Cryptosporangium aurantiacum TaxID=134849 RepID=A0A1M7JCU7_9ACTN|nr:histidine kinase [Cryptosporangium aurantiacum]SHM50920.1 Signal transduction histidine kinase [Cryptosporangium aurantiacum]
MEEPGRRRTLLPPPLRARWHRLGTLAQDTVFAAVLLLLSVIPGVAGIGVDLAELPKKQLDPLGAALVVALCVPLVLRRRWPAACLALAGIGFALHQSLAYPLTAASLTLIIALYSVGAYQRRGLRLVAAAGTAGYVVLALVLHSLGSPERSFEYVTFYGVLVAVWGAGDWMRRQRATAEAVRAASVTAALATERAVIARELHDVVTHHVTAMVVQSDAAGYLVGTNPERAADALATVSGTGRQALTELRHLLQVLDPADDADRQPAVGKLEDLVERIRALGQPVAWTEHGERRPTGGGVDLAVYRVVQEALTNAVKHAHGRPTRVRLDHTDGRIAVEVVTDGSVTTDGSAPVGGGAASGGRGLTGLRERVSVFGGEFAADPTPGGGFRVHAEIPVAVAAP